MLKNNIAWLKKNFKSDMKIWKELVSEVDWKDVRQGVKNDAAAACARIADEAKEVREMNWAERRDLLLNGEKHLGRLYQKDKIAFTRRSGRAWRAPPGTLSAG
jgi:hypothetical protein